LYGLLHDAAEAFIGDVSSPLKSLLPDYKEIEFRVEKAILSRFGLAYPMPLEVKRADLIMLSTEQRDLLPPHDDEWEVIKNVKALSEKIIPLEPSEAKKLFLQRFYELTI
jgi:5'-deoxynucleotidase YfbR-like HD superfamily hydrolase